MKLTICNEILEIVPSFDVIAYKIDLNNEITAEVSELLHEVEKEYLNKYEMTEIVKLPKLKATRDGYKKLGKDPSHTRPATESLIRRLVRGTSIYRLGDIIDLGNIISIKTERSVCVVDYDKLVGDIYIRLGLLNEFYETINRGPLNIYRLPVYSDNLGPFGNPTSDTLRTAVDNTTKTILIMLICFDNSDKLLDESILLEMYQKYTKVTNINKIEVHYGKF